MSRFYSQATGNCYLANGPVAPPADAVEISDELFFEVIANPVPGKIRSHGSDGLPFLIDAPYDPTADERAWRDVEISSTEWLVNRHRDEQDMNLSTTLSGEQFAELLAYRQALRDWPQSQVFPDSTKRPLAPYWIDE